MYGKLLKHRFICGASWKTKSDVHKVTFQVMSTTTRAQDEEKTTGANQAQLTSQLLEKEVTLAHPLPLSSMPGPRGLRKVPYIGTALMFKPFSEYSPETFGKMVSHMHDKYGCVFKSRLGKDYSVHTDNVKDIETIFRTEGAYPLRRLMTLSRVFRERNNLPHALGTTSGPEWHELRSPLNPLLNRPQVCLHYLPAQNQVADDFVSKLENHVFSPQQLSEEFFKFAAESIGVVCFNHRLGFLSCDLYNLSDRIQLLEAFKTALHCTFIAMIGLERRYLKNSDDAFYLRYEAAMKFIRKQSLVYVEKVMRELNEYHTENYQRTAHNEDHMGKCQRTELNDHMGNCQSTEIIENHMGNCQSTEIIENHMGSCQSSHSLSSKGNNESNLLTSMILNSKLDIEKILAIIDSMLIAGTDSTARNLAILFYNLAKNPDVQINAAKEVIDLLGPYGPVTPEALAKMNYVKACVKESMRINFPLSNGTERILNMDTILSGYLVPKGTSVIMSSSRTSLDSTYFDDPLKFMPERWLRDVPVGREEKRTTNKKGSSFACLPFGHGARGCIGRRFAEMEIYVATAKVLQKLEINISPSYPGLNPIYTPFITPREPIPFVFTERKY